MFTFILSLFLKKRMWNLYIKEYIEIEKKMIVLLNYIELLFSNLRRISLNSNFKRSS